MEVEFRPEVERMVLDRVQRGEYRTASALVNAAVENMLTLGNGAESKPHPRSMQMAQDAPANLEWLARHGTAYLGEWVALHKGQLVAHGTNARDVLADAQKQGIKLPLMHRVIEEVAWGGW